MIILQFSPVDMFKKKEKQAAVRIKKIAALSSVT